MYGNSSSSAPESGNIVRPRLRSQKTPPIIIGAEGDALGNAGITTFTPGTESNGLLWWGMYPEALNKVQLQLIETRRPDVVSVTAGSTCAGSKSANLFWFGYRPKPDPQIWQRLCRKPHATFFQSWSNERVYCLALGLRQASVSVSRQFATFNVLMYVSFPRFRFKPPIDNSVLPVDPLFLPSQLAHRFFHAYAVIVHPLNPIIDLDQVRESISEAYTGGVGFPQKPADRPSEHIRSMHKARNLLVLALGAQIEGGDGDAHCPKEVARAWSKQLADQAIKVLANTRENGTVDAVRIWVLYAVYLGNYGQVDGESCSAEIHCDLMIIPLQNNTLWQGVLRAFSQV